MFNPITLTKICTQCGKEKPLNSFHRRRHYVSYGHRAACKVCTLEATRKSKKSVKEEKIKSRARYKTQKAIKSGQLIPQPCQICGNPDVMAHHIDYTSPDAHLEIQWLCQKHHALIHGKRGWTKQMELFMDWS